MSNPSGPPATSRDDLVLIDDQGDYAILTINRPQKRNAMSVDAMARLREALALNVSKKVLVLTGAGASFCAGVDLSPENLGHLDEIVAQQGSQVQHPWARVQTDIREHPAVIIAAVNGFALGGGSTLINSCDLAIAGESAQIALPEMGFGGWPIQAGPALIQRVAPKHAAELILTSRRADAATAFRMALVNKVVADDDLLDEAVALAQHIAAFDAAALDFAKRAINRIQSMNWDESQDYSNLISSASSMRSASPGAGVADFLAGSRGPGQGE
ncbi:enoyl-CoA hydratase/isomerase family protein [Arthrobacter sp. TMT4-20]